MDVEQQRRDLLRLCRAAMPSAAGVLLATHRGTLVAHEEGRVPAPEALAHEAATTRRADTSTLVARESGLYLVMFVPQPPSDQSVSSGAPALAA